MLLGMVLATTALEAVLRWVTIPAIELHRRGPIRQEDHRKLFTYDAELGWRGRAGASGPFSGWEFSTQVHLNELGFREALPWTDKSAGQYELVVFGDSITWGFGVEEGQRYSDRLAEELSKLGVNVVVRNMAVNGYDTGQELLLYRRLRENGCPDAVLIGLYSNDVNENLSSRQGAYPKPYFQSVQGKLRLSNVPVPSETGWSGDRSEVERSGASWWREGFRTYAFAAWMRETIRQAVQAEPVMTSSQDERGIEVTAALLRVWASEIEQDRGSVAVVVLPDASAVVHAETPAPVVAATRSGASHVLDLTEAFREAGRADDRALFYRFDGAHWTSRAHELAAQQIAPFLTQTAFFRKAPRQCPARS